MAGKIQKEDIKTVAELVSAGATAASLPQDTQIYVTANSLNKTLNAAITAGDLSGAVITANRAAVSNGSGALIAATTTDTEIGYVNGVTSAIQTQINSKVTDPFTTKGDILVRNATVPTRRSVGVDGTFLKADSSDATGLSFTSTISTSAFRTVTGNDTCTNADDTIAMTTSSLTETLFTSVGNTGKILTLIHDGTSWTNVMTIDANSTELIGSSLTIKMYIKGEILRIQANGTGWIILNHYIPQLTTYLSHELSSGTDGGSSTSGSYQTRTLNTQRGDTTFCSLSSNQFTLKPGTYHIESEAVFYLGNGCKSKIRNITDSTDTLVSIIANQVGTASATSGNSTLMGTFNITADKVFELQHRVTVTNSGDGYGVACSFGDTEVYAIVKITRVSA